MLGIGIFLAPPQMAADITSPAALLAVWAGTGLIILGGALAYAELASRMPQAGGDYVYLREAFGPSAAFAAGWGLVAAIFAGSVAAVAVALCQYQLPTLLGFDASRTWLVLPVIGEVAGHRVLGAAVVLGLTWLNALGVRPSTAVQKLATLVPVGVLVVFSLWCLALVAADALPEGARAAPASLPAGPRGTPALDALVRAYLAAYFAFSGWNAVVYVSGEVRDPTRTLPRALLIGTLGVTGLYLLLCTAFVAVLGMDGLRAAGEAGSAIAGAVFGPVGRLVMTALIALALISTINAAILGGARVAWAMADDGAFWRRAARLHPRRGTPVFALWVQAGWSVALIASDTFDGLLRAVSVTMIAIGALAVVALFMLRRRGGRAPFSVPRALAWLPWLYLVSSVAVLAERMAAAVRGEPGALRALVGLGVVAAAWLVHRRLLSRPRRLPPRDQGKGSP